MAQQSESVFGQMVTRSIIEPLQEHTVFASAPVKPFKSSFNTMVTQLIFTASESIVTVFDQDANQLAMLQLESSQIPIALTKSQSQLDASFFVIYKSHLTMFKVKTVDSERLEEKTVTLVQDWTRAFTELNVTGSVKEAAILRVKGRSRLCLLSEDKLFVI